jgi:small subunit ribosomal protein S4e
MVTKGRNTGRIGTVLSVEKHPGSFDIVTIKDVEGTTFATRLGNVFTVGKGGDLKDVLVTIPLGKGVKLDIFQQRDRNAKKNA